MERALELGFWISLGTLAWTYAGFALALGLWGVLRWRHVRQHPFTPRATVILVARERDSTVESRLRAVLAFDYPKDRLEVLVVPSGRIGPLAALARRVEDPRVRFIEPARRGAEAARAAAVEEATGDILVFPVSQTMMHPDALRMLARNFADAKVGGVCGNRLHLRSRGEDTALRGERLFADWDKWLRSLENRAGSIALTDRTIWAIRRELYREVAPDAAPALAIPAGVVERGYRFVWEAKALAWERGDSASFVLQRRVESARRRLRTLGRTPSLLNPFRCGFWSLTVFSHVLRWLSPVFLLVLFAGSAALSDTALLYRTFFWAQCAFYALAVLGWMARSTRVGRNPVLCLPLFICLGWSAAAAAIATVGWGRLRSAAGPYPAHEPAAKF